MKHKIVTCPMCLGQGAVGVFVRNRCKDCDGKGWLTVPMSRAEQVREMTDEEMAQVMLAICRSSLNDSGDLYELWCDEKGGCIGPNGEDFCPDGCSEEMQLSCILRYLRAPADEQGCEHEC